MEQNSKRETGKLLALWNEEFLAFCGTRISIDMFTGSFPEPDESIPYLHARFLKIRFNGPSDSMEEREFIE
jgi:hypothetical protein